VLNRVGGMTDKPNKSSKGDMEEQTTQKRPSARLSREIQGRIGNNLRAMYDDVVRQGVPDRFAELLQKLDSPGRKDSAE
jgi:hypothetical protein